MGEVEQWLGSGGAMVEERREKSCFKTHDVAVCMTNGYKKLYFFRKIFIAVFIISIIFVIANNVAIVEMRKEIEHIYHLYYPELVRFVERYIPDKGVAHDFVSDAFLRLWEEYEDETKKFDQTHVRAWLYKVIHNAVVNYLRDLKIQDKHHVLLAEAMLLAEPEDPAENDDSEAHIIKQVNDAIDQLPPQCRKIVRSISLEGKKYQEVADELGISINSVRTQILRGFKKLREILSSDPEIYRMFVGMVFRIIIRNRER